VFLIENKDIRIKGTVRVKLKKEEDFVYGVAFLKEDLKTTMKLAEHREKIQSLDVSHLEE